MKRIGWVRIDTGWIGTNDVEFVDISEGLYGDIMTFIYEGAEYESLVVFGSRPG